MATIVERSSDGIIYRAAKTYPIPNVDVLTLLFGKDTLLVNHVTNALM
jgi:4-coumarate--CoA ligase